EQVQCPDRVHQVGLDRVSHVALGAGRTGQVVDLVGLDIERLDDVVLDQGEPGMLHQVGDVRPASGDEVVDGDHVVAGCQERVTEMRPDEAGAAGDKYAHAMPP